MTRCLLSIGSNCPDCREMMRRAGEWLAEEFASVATSGVYSTAAHNGVSPDYLNMVAEVTSDLSAERLIEAGKAFERRCGRTAGSKVSGIVEMDIDLIRYGSVILRPEEFTRPYFMQGYDILARRGH